jgi:hypothetical protein
MDESSLLHYSVSFSAGEATSNPSQGTIQSNQRILPYYSRMTYWLMMDVPVSILADLEDTLQVLEVILQKWHICG